MVNLWLAIFYYPFDCEQAAGEHASRLFQRLFQTDYQILLIATDQPD